MKTYSATPSDIEKKWFVIDAEDLVLGRLAVIVADLLRGKHKTTFTPHMDCGDHVIVVNAGGIKSRTPEQILAGKYPERVVQKAVQRMLPRGPLGRQQFSNLRVYGGAEHPHEAQQPEVFDVRALSPKNIRRVG